MTIVSFQKTNGQDANINGISSYVMYYAASVDFPSGYRSNCIRDNGEFAGFDCGFEGIRGAPAPIRAGSRLNVQGTISFQKAERGWLIGHVTVTTMATTPVAVTTQSVAAGNPSGLVPIAPPPRPTLTPIPGTHAEDCYIALNSNGQQVVGYPFDQGWRFGINGVVSTFNQRDSQFDSRSGAYTARAPDRDLSVRIVSMSNDDPEVVNLLVRADGATQNFRAFRFCSAGD